MKKITELTVKSFRTVHTKDANGNRIKSSEPYTRKRTVNTIAQGPRFAHLIIDGIVFQIIYYIIEYILTLFYSLANNTISISLTLGLFGLILTLLSYPAVYAFFEYKWQKTPAKFLTKTLVIDEYGNKPDLRTIILRSLIRIVPFEPFSCLSNAEKVSRGWHDRWSNTWVVTDAELAELKRLQQEQSN
jgi:uncharacterized RDD family membrane protein YckC